MASVWCFQAIVLAACAVLAAASLRDIAVRTVSNRLCAVLVVLGAGLRIAGGDWPFALLAAILVFILAAACWARAWLGGGDVKLLTAAALLVPAASVPSLIAATAMAGGVLSLGYLLLSGLVTRPQLAAPHRVTLAGPLARVIRAERWRISGRRPLPYACAITAGAFITLLRA